MSKIITFNKPFLTGKETVYIEEAVKSGKISGNGMFTQKCQSFFEQKYGFRKALLTTSCTDALEMAAILLDVKPGDEIIVPSYTFVSTALAFVREGAKIVFADSRAQQPNIDADKLEALITSRTKAIVVVHYAGVACDMDRIMELASKHNLFVVEDIAQAIDSDYVSSNGTKKPLGTIGHLSAFSFHETKNIIAGEGGLLGINDDQFKQRSEIIWEKGTNRAEFFRGEVNKYGWVDTGSSFLPSEITAAFLWAQLEHLDEIQSKRRLLWNTYNESLGKVEEFGVTLPHIPIHATNNGHMYYLVCKSKEQRTKLISGLKELNIKAVFHYLSLHASSFYEGTYGGGELVNSDCFTDRLVRLPMYYELSVKDVKLISNAVIEVLKRK